MKKLLNIFAALAIIASLALPGVAIAQVESVDSFTDPESSDIDEYGDFEDPEELPSTGAVEGSPNTGIAPNSLVAKNLLVFVAGSLLGAGIGVGILQIKKRL